MGWTAMHRENGLKTRQVFANEFPSIDILEFAADPEDSTVFYAAVRNKEGPNRPVYALVILTSRRSEYFNFAYKDMDESEGPVDRHCPLKILNRLSPLPEPEGELDKWQYARKWRQDCRDWHGHRVRLQDGCAFKTKEPTKFGSAGTHQYFVCVNASARHCFAVNVDNGAVITIKLRFYKKYFSEQVEKVWANLDAMMQEVQNETVSAV